MLESPLYSLLLKATIQRVELQVESFSKLNSSDGFLIFFITV